MVKYDSYRCLRDGNVFMTKNYNRILGTLGEAFAKDFLENKGFSIMAQNFRKKSGEIDLICRDEKMIVFVEVKARMNNHFGLPANAVDYEKIMHIIDTGLSFLEESGLEDHPWRVDVVGVLFDDKKDNPEITHYEGIRIDG